ncbi:MAG: hypothetical protein ACD_3C00051G0012 [uncultured bacterium (gcode 4)]|uniref:Radical SAM core domain-containing protein n=1 Tax=uncultured bacterium (gcode 4) TaxID=1234023 RepID=K2GE33_9BACT|nr:MAG: hypothetical protein ACD_3C00051G0012 [uncultured bacterium (gcode 4)]
MCTRKYTAFNYLFKSFLFMVIVLTRRCNSNCGYCGVYKKDSGRFFVPWLQIDDLLDKIVLLSESYWDNEMRFFWWEPYLERDLLESIITRSISRGFPFRHVINSNWKLLDDEALYFAEKNKVKLILSCNWELSSHILTRWWREEDILKLYGTISKICSKDIDYQINFTILPATVENMIENVRFLYGLWVRNLNILVWLYIWWTEEGIGVLKEKLDELSRLIKTEFSGLAFANHFFSSQIPLFNSEVTIDSDGIAYPNMVILENFFNGYKHKIKLADLKKDKIEFKKDIDNADDENFRICESYIKKIIEDKLGEIAKRDYSANEALTGFFKSI